MPFPRRDLLRFAACGYLVTGTALPARAASGAAPDPALPPGAESRFAVLNGVRLHDVVAGRGPALVLLHGWPQTWFAWAGTMRALSDHSTVIATDLRGLGRSERTATGYDKRTIATDVRALIGDVAGGRAHVVGHDMGGKAAYLLAHLYPECVSRLVLVDCLVPSTENADALRGGAWHYGFHMAAAIPELLTAGRERDYIAAQIQAWSYRKDAIGEGAITEYARHYASPGGMTAGFAYYRALPEDGRQVKALRGKTLTMPVLAIAGRHGVGLKLFDALQDVTSDLTAVVAEESGHFVAEEVPDFFHAQLKRFLMA